MLCIGAQRYFLPAAYLLSLGDNAGCKAGVEWLEPYVTALLEQGREFVVFASRHNGLAKIIWTINSLPTKEPEGLEAVKYVHRQGHYVRRDE